MKNIVKNGIIGFAIGDALGVPVEFMSREELSLNPVVDMNREYGTHNQPLGTFSDDTSMTLATLKSLSRGIDYDDIMEEFLRWYKFGAYTAHHEVFDIGIATQEALHRYMKGESVFSCGGKSVYDNGNGSLMRMLPVAYYLFKTKKNQPFTDATFVHDISSLTHGHPRSLIACEIYVRITLKLLSGCIIGDAISKTIDEISNNCEKWDKFVTEFKFFTRLRDVETFAKLPVDEIKSTGYVVDTLEASLWCLLNTNNYVDAVLKAVNLGEDTDTIGAITGGLAAIIYGIDEIPKTWIENLVNRTEIEKICSEFEKKVPRKKLLNKIKG